LSCFTPTIIHEDVGDVKQNVKTPVLDELAQNALTNNCHDEYLWISQYHGDGQTAGYHGI
jgi:hypothetical protein